MHADTFALSWASPRASEETNRHNRQMVGRFAAAFAGREIDSIEIGEATSWGLGNLGNVRYVKAMVNDAVAAGAATRNVFAQLRLPKPPPRRRDDRVPTELEVQALLHEADWQMGAVIALGAYVGLRQSEILGLGYVGLHVGVVGAYVHQQLARDGKTLKPIKGKVKAREVEVFRVARPYIERWAENPFSSETFVTGGGVPQETVGNRPLTHGELRGRWDRLREITGLALEFHQLRTFCATWLLEKGASPIDVAIQLHGHTDPTVVLSYYAMVDKSKGLERLRRLVDG